MLGTGICPTFEVPVFRDEMSTAAQNHVAVPSIFETFSINLTTILSEEKIKLDTDGSGMPLSIVCSPERHQSLIGFLVVFNLFCTVAAVFLVKQDAPLLFQIVWPFTASLIWFAIFWQLLYTRTARFIGSELKLRHQFGPFSSEETLQKSDITGFRCDTNLSSNHVDFYRVRLKRVTGKKKTMAGGQ
jgi:hypothetical protein